MELGLPALHEKEKLTSDLGAVAVGCNCEGQRQFGLTRWKWWSREAQHGGDDELAAFLEGRSS